MQRAFEIAMAISNCFAGRSIMNPLVYCSVAAAASVGALFGTAAPALAAGAKPLAIKVTYRAATDEYCVDMANVAGPGTASPLPTVQCRSKADWAAERLAISRN
jgi:hypothetical protein